MNWGWYKMSYTYPDFLQFLQNKCPQNLTFIKRIRFNKRSFTVTIDDDGFVFNEFFTEKRLYSLILRYLVIYLSNKDILSDYDFLEYKYKKMNIKRK